MSCFSSKLHVRYMFSSQLARESFPPCMHHLHEALRRDHHLRHFGRLQYGLFLKSIGLTLEQALTFWRTEFTKKMEPDKVCEEASSICIYIHACFFFALYSESTFTFQCPTCTIVLWKSAHPQNSVQPLLCPISCLGSKVYSNEHPPWSKLCVANEVYLWSLGSTASHAMHIWGDHAHSDIVPLRVLCAVRTWLWSHCDNDFIVQYGHSSWLNMQTLKRVVTPLFVRHVMHSTRGCSFTV